MKLSQYLSGLKFDPSLNKGFVASYLTNFRFVSLLFVTILGLGIVSFMNLPRRLNPEVNIPYIGVSSVLPGAAPNDVESLVTIPLEDELVGIDGLSEITSTSRESVSSILLKFDMGVDVDRKKQEVQSAVDNVVDLPEDATTPKVAAADIADSPVWKFALTANDPVTLYRFSGELSDKLDRLSKVKKVDLRGRDPQEVQIIIDAEKINQLGINPALLGSSLKALVGSYPAGSVRQNGDDLVVSVESSVDNIEDLYNLPVKINGKVLSLSEIASVYRRSKPGSSTSLIASPEESPVAAVTFEVYRTDTADVVETVVESKALVEKEIKAYSDVNIVNITDSADEISTQFGDLYGNFGSTVVLVFLTLFLFLGIRQSLIVSMSIPLTFLSVFFIMNTAGITLNFLSVFALLLSLGLLMDDAIVIVESMSRYYKTGKFSADEAGLLVWRDFIVPIWSTTITTVWAFVPLLMSSGITGEFIKSIPVVVTAALMSSTFVAVSITLPLMMKLVDLQIAYRVKILFAILLFVGLIFGFVWLVPVTWLIVFEVVVFLLFLVLSYKIRRQLAEKVAFHKWSKYLQLLQGGFLNLNKITAGYRMVLDKIISSSAWRKRVVWMVIIFAFFSYALVPLGFVKNEFFPKTDMDLIYLGIEMSAGTASRKTEMEVLNILERIRIVGGVDYATGEVGYKISTDGGGSSGSNLATITIKLVDKEKRDFSSIEIADNLRKMFSDFTGGKIDVIELSGGPPAGADVEIRILGDDLSKLEELSNEAVSYLESQPGVINIDKSVKPGVSKLGFEADPVKLSEASISSSSLGFWMRSFLSGFELDEVKFDGDKEKVVFYFDRGLFSSDQLDRLMVPGANGPAPLSSLGKFVLKANPEKISREDGKRVITVSASVEKGYVATDVNNGLIEFTGKMDIPAGYEWRSGGANEENQKSVTSIIQAMGLAAVLILITMVLQLGSYRKALIVLMVIPLAVSGVFVLFALTGTPLSFPSLIGMLALFGIVVNNSIMVVERINQNIKSKIDFKISVIEASAGRVEPIVFSSMTTVLGLIPISLSDPLWRGLGGAIISGLIFSGSIMLFFIPVVYYSWFKGDQPSNFKK